MSASPLLRVQGLRVEIPTRRGLLLALDDISFEIAPGEILGFVGESGAGKSLTGMAILGLLDPPGRIAAGEIRLGERRIQRSPRRRPFSGSLRARPYTGAALAGRLCCRPPAGSSP